MDLPGADRTVLDKVQQTLGFSPEVITYCLLRYRAAKVIHTDSGLFLVTFLTLPHSSSLFTLWELKMCVSSRFLLTVHRLSSPAPLSLESRLPGLRGAIDLGTGHLLRLILEGTVRFYGTIVAEIERRLPREEKRDLGQTPETAVAKIEDYLPRGEEQDSEQTPEEQAWNRRVSRVEKFALFLQDQRVFLQNVEREGRKLFHPDDCTRLKWLEERVGVLARIAQEAAQMLREGKKKTPAQEV